MKAKARTIAMTMNTFTQRGIPAGAGPGRTPASSSGSGLGWLAMYQTSPRLPD